MSIDLFNTVWQSGLENGLLVMMAIADEAGDDGIACPRLDTIARKARCDVRTVQRHIRAFAESGILVRNQREGTSNEYIIIPDKLPRRQNVTPDKLFAGQPQKVANKMSPDSIKNIEYINKGEPESVVRAYDPDQPDPIKEKSKTPRTAKPKQKKYHESYNITMAPVVAELCELSLQNGSRALCYDAADLLRKGSNPPARDDLIPLFGRGGRWYREWPGNQGQPPKPMDIAKLWPRYSGAIKAPAAQIDKREMA